MPTLLSRRYVRPIEKVSTTEKVVGLALLLLTAGIVAAFVVQVATDKDNLFEVDEGAYAPVESRDADTLVARELQPVQPAVGSAVRTTTRVDPKMVRTTGLFPDPGIDGWIPPRHVSRYTPDTLHVKINGRAPVYTEAGLVTLIFGRYSHRGDPGLTVDVYWYDMGTADNARAVYRAEAAPGAAPVPFGREGYQSGGAFYFWTGSGYVQVLPADVDGATAQAARIIAQKLAEHTGRP